MRISGKNGSPGECKGEDHTRARRLSGIAWGGNTEVGEDWIAADTTALGNAIAALPTLAADQDEAGNEQNATARARFLLNEFSPATIPRKRKSPPAPPIP